MKSARTDDMIDLYIQFVLKQGQIELPNQPAELSPSQYRNTNVELIHRREVETLNQAIIVRGLHPSSLHLTSLQLGLALQESANLKIRQMEKCKHVCNDLHSMEW